MIRLYGIDRGNGSWARVSRGVRSGLQSTGKLAGFFDVSQVDHAESGSLGPGYDATIAVCVGPPLSSTVMVGQGDHQQRLLLIATNSDWLPGVMMERASKVVTGFIGTSSWATSVIKNYSHGQHVFTWPHGVDSRFTPVKRSGEQLPGFDVLHMSSTHLQRKGTTELIFAWAKAKAEGSLPEEATLRLVMDGPRGYYLDPIHKATKGSIALADSYNLMQRLDLSIEDLREFYSRHHVVCQPSRAEGFGLVPLEALACGVPVVATACTGHAEYLRRGDVSWRSGLHGGSAGAVVVPHGPDAPVDDGPGAMAPTVDVDDLAQALCDAYDNWLELHQEAQLEAKSIHEQWSWSAVTKKFLEELENE